MKRIIKVRRLELPEAARKALVIIAFLSICDALVAFSGASYLSRNIGAFLGKSPTVILSDLLFLEGVIVFATGSFIAVATATQKTEPSSNSSTDIADDAEQTPKRKNTGTLMMITGAVLIGLSITVGTLLA